MDIIPKRLAEIENIALKSGAHDDISHGACVMEAVSFVAGEPWSDRPECACPVIGSFLRTWNDDLPDDKRTELLRPLVPRLVGTRGSGNLERRRALMCAGWLVGIYTPAWLRLAKLNVHADALASLPEITDMAQVPLIIPVIEAARRDAIVAGNAAKTAARNAAWTAASNAAWTAAWDAAKTAAKAAARDAARDAAWDAAWDAAKAAAKAAARDAAWNAAGAAAWNAAGAAASNAAWNAASNAAWNAASNAAGAAAGDAARDALAPTVEHLQQSALDLVNRMIEAAD
jgi:hypothetical protein